MLVIGLTGSTGSGKGCVCELLSKHGINSIDTDKTSRSVCDVGKPCLCELTAFFGSGILENDGSLNRKKLAEIAFSTQDNHKALNTITHKYILNEVRLWLDSERNKGAIAAIVDAPLLFESGFDKECDVIVAVTAPIDTRFDRVLKRDCIDTTALKQRMSKQGADDFYTSKADYVIENNGTLDDLKKQTDDLLKKLFG